MKKFSLMFFMVFFAFSFAMAQRTVSGTITDDLGDALIGANVLLKGTTVGTVTDINGSYSLKIPAETVDPVLVVSYTGYSTQEIPLGESNSVNITMLEGVDLEDVVVIGYGTAKEGSIIESISTVDGDEISNIPIASVDNLLQGRSTGVEVTAINGKPGQNGYIRVRGLTSINGNNDPLFIVDGIPVPKSVYSAINPNDIAEFSILKDAAATSIYGARASAGVVLITTKRGSSKNSYIEYSIQAGVNSALDDGLELMDATQKLNYEQALGLRGPLTAEGRAELLKYGTDWEDLLLRDAGLISHNLSFSGGNEVGNFFLSMSRFDNQGLSVGSDFDRTSFKFNGGYKINDWLNVSNSLSVSRRNDNELRDRYNVQSPFVAMYTYNPYETVYQLDDDGKILYDDFGDPIYNLTRSGFNIVEAQRNNPESREWSDIYGNISLTFTPLENFSFTTTGGYTYNNFKNNYFIKPNSTLDGYVGDPDAPGIKRESGNDRDRYVWTNVATYDYELDSRNGLSFLAGTEFIKDQFESRSISAKGFPVGLSTLDVAAEITDGFTSLSEFSLFSVFGQAAYSFDNNFNLKATVRRDGSSRFGADNRYGTFWAIGASYDLARTAIQNNIFDQLKLRASYGTTGNEPSELYASIGKLAFAQYNDQTAAFQVNVENPNLKWETQKSYSIGLDFGVLNNKVTGSLEYYNKTSYDLLFPNQLSRTTGFESRVENIGDISNRGFEAEVYYSPLRGTSDITLDFGLRFSNNKTKVDKINTTDEINPSNAFGSVLKEGEVAYVWKLVEFKGVDTQTGDLVYYDAEGEETTTPTASDSKIMSGKSAVPTYWGGFDINVGYKGLLLETQFSFKGGNYIYNQRYRDLVDGLDGARDQQSVDALDYWRQPGDETDIPRPDVQVEPTDSDRFLEKGDYIRLRNVKLSYQLPLDISQKVKMQNVTLFIAGSNLATITDFKGDPEVGVFIEESASTVGGQLPGEYAGFSYPNTRSITGGVTIRF